MKSLTKNLIQNFIGFCKDNLPYKERLALICLGVYSIISTIPFIYNLSRNFLTLNNSIYVELSFYFIFFVGNIFIILPLFLEEKNFLYSTVTILWNLLLLNLLSISYILVSLSNFSQLQLACCLANILITCLLLRWKTALAFIISSFLISLPQYAPLDYDAVLSNSKNLEFTIAFSLLFISGIILALLSLKDKPLYILENECSELKKMLKELEIDNSKKLKIRDKYLDIILEEFKPIINYISHTSQKMYKQWEEVPNRELYKIIRYISSNSKYLSNFINNFSNYIKLHKEGINLNFQKTDLASLVKKQVREFKSGYCMEKNIKIHIKIGEGVDYSIFCDKLHIMQIMSILLINTGDSMQYGEITVTVRKHHINIGQNNYSAVYVIIKDNGIGIPEKDLDSIFSTFEKNNMTESHEEIKKGFSLALCRKIIHSHYGKVVVRSNEKENGNSFIFAIPQNFKEIDHNDKLLFEQEEDLQLYW